MADLPDFDSYITFLTVTNIHSLPSGRWHHVPNAVLVMCTVVPLPMQERPSEFLCPLSEGLLDGE